MYAQSQTYAQRRQLYLQRLQLPIVLSEQGLVKAVRESPALLLRVNPTERTPAVLQACVDGALRGIRYVPVELRTEAMWRTALGKCPANLLYVTVREIFPGFDELCCETLQTDPWAILGLNAEVAAQLPKTNDWIVENLESKLNLSGRMFFHLGKTGALRWLHTVKKAASQRQALAAGVERAPQDAPAADASPGEPTEVAAQDTAAEPAGDVVRDRSSMRGG